MVDPLTSDDPRDIAGYQIRARLGAGGMGRVYLAFTHGGRPVAIKVVRAEFGDDEEFKGRFRLEVAAAQRVHGLYTAQVLDADPDARLPWLATAYVPGLSLQQAVTDFGPLPPDSVLLLVAGIAEALQAIHATGIVHRDLKPSNVILATDGPRVIDFGIAWAAAAPSLTRSGISVGSPGFMAPEQARGQPTTPAVDVFALGSLATYAITGHSPFGQGTAVAVLHRVLHEAPDLADCPPNLRPLIERCLAKDPAQRPRPGEIIDICRARTGAGSLAFDRSWLPSAMFAVAAGAAAVPRAPFLPAAISGQDDAAGAESIFSSKATYSSAVASDRDAFSRGTGGGPPRSVQDASALVSPPPVVASASHGRGRAPRKTVVGGLAVVVLLVAAVAVGIALLPRTARPGIRHLSPQAVAAHRPPAQGPRTRVHPTAAAHEAPGTSSPPGPQPSPSATRSQPGSPTPQPSATSPVAASSSAAPPPSGRAAFGGTWTGTVSQPGGTVTSWTIRLVIPAAGRDGSYSAPSLGCSGTLMLRLSAATAMAAQAHTTSAVNPGCVTNARLTLTLSGSNGISMSWVPAGRSHEFIGTARLTDR